MHLVQFFFLEFSLIALHVQNVFTVIVERRQQVPFSTPIENWKLMHECYPKYNDSEYAYHNNSSTEQALVNVTEQIYKSIDKGKISLLVLLDLSKAFDGVNHDLLLNKLVHLNIDSKWSASYLHDWTFSKNR